MIPVSQLSQGTSDTRELSSPPLNPAIDPPGRLYKRDWLEKEQRQPDYDHTDECQGDKLPRSRREPERTDQTYQQQRASVAEAVGDQKANCTIIGNTVTSA